MAHTERSSICGKGFRGMQRKRKETNKRRRNKMKKDDLYYNNSRYSFAKHIAPVLNDLEEENEENIYFSPRVRG